MMKKKIGYMTVVAWMTGSFFLLNACSSGEQILFEENSIMEWEEKDAEAVGTEEQVSLSEEEILVDGVVFKENKQVAVHVCGAVTNPGVYLLEEGSRVMDAVLSAGGFAKDADEEYINLATTLKDGDKIRIPTKSEVIEMSNAQKEIFDIGVTNTNEDDMLEEVENETGKVNINTADKEELCTLPGIGQTRAESILSYRKEYGSFIKIEDIMKVSGIKENSFQKIKDKITVK